jgi:hypothetical protein
MSNVFRCICCLFGALLVGGTARAQGVGYGDWQLHLPTNHPLHLADAGDRVYVATENAFYFLDKALNTTQVLSRRDGLNDVGVIGLAYDSLSRQTVAVYKSNNIDVIQPNGQVRNLNDILRKTISGSRNIYQVYTADSRAYLSADFGLIVINLNKLEVSETYSNIGPGGQPVQVFSTTISHDTIFTATSAGILRGKLSSTINLLDYRSWTLLPAPSAGAICRNLATYASHVYAAMDGAGVFLYRTGTPGNWSVPFAYSGQYRRLQPSRAGLLIADDASGIRRVDRSGIPIQLIPPPAGGDATLDVIRSRDGSYYVANSSAGLQRVVVGPPLVREPYVANGPESRLGFGVLADARSNKVDIFSGGFEDRYLPFYYTAGFYEYDAGQWTNITATSLPNIAQYPNLIDLSRGARTPEGTLYVGSYGDGLLEWKGPGQFHVFNESNSPILSIIGGRTARITDVTADANGDVWVVNRHQRVNTSGLHVYTPSTLSWRTIPFFPGADNLERIALDDNGFVWVSEARKADRGDQPLGIFAIDPAAGTTQLFTKASGLPENEIYDLIKDRRGDIWAATIKGIAVMNGPSGAFLPGAAFRTPIVRRGDGTGFPVLFNEAVKAIAVDGGNRKWLGTDRGLWLFSEDADEALLHFTKANSPLPSDRIIDVDVNDKTGEVWIATDAGVVSYRGSATVTDGAPNCTKVSPNPVRPDFTGQVGISGLTNNALVKITDIAGHLVYATKASGGTVTWNMTNANGERVRSGVYLVLSSDADGKNGCVSKVAVLSK